MFAPPNNKHKGPVRPKSKVFYERFKPNKKHDTIKKQMQNIDVSDHNFLDTNKFYSGSAIQFNTLSTEPNIYQKSYAFEAPKKKGKRPLTTHKNLAESTTNLRDIGYYSRGFDQYHRSYANKDFEEANKYHLHCRTTEKVFNPSNTYNNSIVVILIPKLQATVKVEVTP